MAGLGFFILGAVDSFAKEKVLKICDSFSDKTYTMDPHKAGDENNLNQLHQIFERLLEFDPEDNHIIPSLATAWKRITPTIIHMKLRKGVRFHNGELFDAEAVRFSLERVINPETSSYASLWHPLERVDVVDRYTVSIKTKYPDALIFQRLVAFGIVVSPKQFKEVGMEGMAKHPIGTGPFKFKEWIKGEKIVLTANKGYWNPGEPKIDKAEFYFYDVNSRFEKFMSGELDMISDIKPNVALKVAKGKDNKVIKRDSLLSVFIAINTIKEGPLKNKMVRKALNYAVDVPKIIKYGAKGNGTPTATVAAKGDVGFHPNLKPYPYDPEKAKQLLAEAGYPDGFKLTAVVFPHVGGAEGPFAKIVKSQLKAVGIELDMKTSDSIKEVLIPVMNQQVPQVDFNMGIIPSVAGHILLTDYLLFYSKGYVSMVRDPQYDRLFEKAIRTIDPEDHINMCHILEEYIKEQAYYINMYQAKKLFAVKKNINYKPALNGILHLERVEIQ